MKTAEENTKSASKRKQVKKKPPISDDSYRFLPETAGVGIAFYSAKGMILSYNKIAAKHMNGKPEDFTGKSIFDVFPEADAEFYFKRIKKATRSAESQEYIDKVNLPKSVKWFHSTYNRITDPTGRALGVQIISVDISERVLAEEALRQSEERYRKLLESGNDAICVHSMKKNGMPGFFTEANETACKRFEYSRKELLKMTPLDIDAPELKTQMKKNMEILKKDGHCIFEMIHVAKSGRKIPAEVNAHLFEMDGNQMVMSIARDITDRKTAERALMDSESRFRKVFEESRHGIVIVNEQFKFVRANQAFCNMTGYTEKELTSLTFKDITHPDHISGDVANVMRVFRGEMSFYRTEKRYVRKDGGIVWGSAMINSIRDENGNFQYFLTMIEDITEHKKAETALHNSETRYRELFNNIGSGVAIYKAVNNGSDFIFMDFNKAGEKIDKQSKESLIGRSVLEARPGIREFGLYNIFKKVWETGKPIHHPVSLYEDDKLVGWYNNFVYKLPSGEVVAVFENVTEQKQAEIALQISESKFRAVVENIQEGILFTDSNSIIQYRSPSTQKITGFSDEERLGSAGYEIVHPDDQIIFQNALSEIIINPGVIQELVYRIRHRNGSWKWVESTLQNLLSNPDIKAILMTSRDVTKRKLAEENLQRTKQLLQLFIEYAPASITMFDTDLKYIAASRRYMEDFNVKFNIEDIIGKSHYEIFPQIEERIKEVYQRCLAGAIERSDEDFFKRDDGKTDWTKWEVRPWYENSGKIGGIIVFSEIITERKLAEIALHESEERFRHLVESVTDYIYTVQLENGNVVKITQSPGCLGVTGYASHELKKNPNLWFDMIYEDDRTLVTEKLNDVLNGKEVPSIEHRIYHKDGSIRWIRNTPVLKKDGFGNLVAYDGLISDITERKLAEQAKEMIQEQLRQAQKMEALGTFVGGIAHDFNNILSVLMGFANLLYLELDKDNPLNAYVEQILSSSEKAANLTRSLLSFSRKQPITQKTINLNNVLNDMEKILKRLVTEDIKLEIKLHEKDVIIKGDQSQIDQVFLNLSTNARDAMPNGGVISISTCVIVFDEKLPELLGYGRPGKYALITFADNGSGMDKQTQEKIFDPFFTTKDVGKGTGLGMATVYGIVQQHGGHIEIYTEEGSGTAFHIYLPLIESADSESKKERQSLRTGMETILVAEDNENVRFFIRSILTRYGYSVIEAIDGPDTVNKFENHRNIDLVILDLVMPGKNGCEVYNEITRMNSKIKVLFCSGYTQDVMHTKGIVEKDINFLAKPLIPSVLLEKVRDILDKK